MRQVINRLDKLLFSGVAKTEKYRGYSKVSASLSLDKNHVKIKLVRFLFLPSDLVKLQMSYFIRSVFIVLTFIGWLIFCFTFIFFFAMIIRLRGKKLNRDELSEVRMAPLRNDRSFSFEFAETCGKSSSGCVYVISEPRLLQLAGRWRRRPISRIFSVGFIYRRRNESS